MQRTRRTRRTTRHAPRTPSAPQSEEPPLRTRGQTTSQQRLGTALGLIALTPALAVATTLSVQLLSGQPRTEWLLPAWTAWPAGIALWGCLIWILRQHDPDKLI